MAKFLREYWAWILVPFVLVLGAFVAILFLTTGSDPDSTLHYPIF